MTRLDPARTPGCAEQPLAKVMVALTRDGGEARYRRRRRAQHAAGRRRQGRRHRDAADAGRRDKRLQAAGLVAVPTGIEHGTITAVADGKAYEVTTLRHDVETDGRHAVIAFATDWRDDAGRRDFTINALYATADGEIFDYHDGLADLRGAACVSSAMRVARIREDYLRILRLFRFHAWYGKGEIDAVALNAAAAEKSGIAKLSGERIAQEILRLLEAENPLPVLRVMAASGILAEILPGPLDMARLERLCAIDAANFFAPDPVLRLAALLGTTRKPLGRRRPFQAFEQGSCAARRPRRCARKDRLLSFDPRSAEIALSAGPRALQGPYLPALGGRSEAVERHPMARAAGVGRVRGSAPSFR